MNEVNKDKKRNMQCITTAVRPIFIDAINRMIRRAKADLSRSLSKTDIQANDILTSYFNTEYPPFALTTILPVYSGMSDGLGKGDANVCAANMVTRFCNDLLTITQSVISNSQNVASSVDGALQALFSTTSTIADKEIEIVRLEIERGE